MNIPRRTALLAPLATMLTACSTSSAPTSTPSSSTPATPATTCVTLDSYPFEWIGDPCQAGSSNISDDNRTELLDWYGPLTVTTSRLVAWYRGGLVEWDAAGKPARLLAVRSASATTYALVGSEVVVPLCDGRLQRWNDGCPGAVLPGHPGARVVAIAAVDDSRFATLGDDQQLKLWHVEQQHPVATVEVPSPNLLRLELAEGTLWASSPTSCHGYDVTRLSPSGVLTGLPDSLHGWTAAPGRRLVGHADALLIAEPDKGITNRHNTNRAQMYAAASPDGRIGAVGDGRLIIGHVDGTVKRSGYADAPHHPAGLAFAANNTVHLLDQLRGGGQLNTNTDQLLHAYQAPGQ